MLLVAQTGSEGAPVLLERTASMNLRRGSRRSAAGDRGPHGIDTPHTPPRERDKSPSRGLRFAGAVAVLAPRPAAGPALAFLQFLLGPPNASLTGGLLLGILDPADELVAG
jgi:hypothetical protein